MSSMPVYTPSWGTICLGWTADTVSSPMDVCVPPWLSHSTKKAAPPWMVTVRSWMSLMVSKGSLSNSLRSMSSMSLARHSSCFRRGVTFGCGMLESTWDSISSAQMFRTWGVPFFLARSVRGEIRSLPW